MFGTEVLAVIYSMPYAFLQWGYIDSTQLYLLTYLMPSLYQHYLLRSCFRLPGTSTLRLFNGCPGRLCSWPDAAFRDMRGVGHTHRLVAVSNQY